LGERIYLLRLSNANGLQAKLLSLRGLKGPLTH